MPMSATSPISRRKFLKVSTVGAVGSVALVGCATLGLPRIAKADAGYVDNSKGPGHCGGCVHFQAPNGCTVVDGVINPRGVCRYFLAKG
jgi:hypothetical protein